MSRQDATTPGSTQSPMTPDSDSPHTSPAPGRHRGKRVALTVALLLVATGTAIGLRQKPGTQRSATAGLSPLPAVPALEPLELVDAQPFLLDEPFVHYWRKEQPSIRSGYLLVLHADEAFLRPRQTAEPVLYVGTEVAERLNTAQGSGNLICLVPAPLNRRGEVSLDPSSVPIWFGAPDLPERITAARVLQELAAAKRLGVGPAPSKKTLRLAGLTQTLFAHDRTELELTIADLIDRYSPTEASLSASLRVPLTR